MAFAFPSSLSRRILSITDTATSGTVLYPFNIPPDSDTIICKFWTNGQFPGLNSGGTSIIGSAVVYLQTTEDTGTTWRDVGAWAVTSVITAAQAHFQPFPVSIGYARGLGNWVGSIASSTLVVASVVGSAIGMTSGMPMMSNTARLVVTYAGTVSSNLGINVDVFAPTTNHDN